MSDREEFEKWLKKDDGGWIPERPTPPAQDYYLLTAGWLDGHEFIGTPEEARKNPRAVPVYTAHAHKKNSDPTPPAQEDEPVLWLCDFDDQTWYAPNKEGADRYKAEGATVTSLYTRPDNSELRKAAEEVISARDNGTNAEFILSMVNLRAALEGK